MTSTVPPGRSSLHRYPGTSCLATINLSLRDKSHSPTQGARIKLALMRFNPELNGTKTLIFAPFNPEFYTQFVVGTGDFPVTIMDCLESIA
jgi:hypothetical protein